MKKASRIHDRDYSLDILQLYFQDVAQLPILNGRADLVRCYDVFSVK